MWDHGDHESWVPGGRGHGGHAMEWAERAEWRRDWGHELEPGRGHGAGVEGMGAMGP